MRNAANVRHVVQPGWPRSTTEGWPQSTTQHVSSDVPRPW